MEKIGPGKDYSYTGRLKLLELPLLPLKPDWPTPSAAALGKLTSKIDYRFGGTAMARQKTLGAISMWNATHAARYTASQGKIVVNGLLHFKFPEWQRHASALVAGVSKGHSTSLQPAISVTQVTDARSANEAGEMIQNLWRERRLTNIEVLAGAFYKTTNFGPAMSCKALLSLLEFAKIQIPPEGRYTPQEISNRKQRRILFDQPDEFEAYWNAARNAWAPLGSCKPEAAWQILELMGMHFDDPKSFACGDELSRYACVARWLAAEVHRKTETGRSTGHQRSIKPPSPGSKS